MKLGLSKNRKTKRMSNKIVKLPRSIIYTKNISTEGLPAMSTWLIKLIFLTSIHNVNRIEFAGKWRVSSWIFLIETTTSGQSITRNSLKISPQNVHSKNFITQPANERENRGNCSQMYPEGTSLNCPFQDTGKYT